MEAWIRYMAGVNPQTASALMRAIDQRMAEGMSHLHLMISSPGGSVFHGLSIHNFLRSVGIQVSTYNFGSVDSIGVVIFCAGSHRVCVPSSRFHIHGVKLNFRGELSFDEKALEEHLKLMATDYDNIAKVIADTTGQSVKKVVADMNKQTSLMPTDAEKYGLVHEVRNQFVPAQAGMTVIYEDATSFSYQPPPRQSDLVSAEAVTGSERGTTEGGISMVTSRPIASS